MRKPPWAGETRPQLVTNGARTLYGIDPEQAHAAQDEREDRALETGTGGHAAGRDRPAIPDRLENVGQDLATDRIDRRRPLRLVQGLVGSAPIRGRHDTGRPQTPEIGLRGRLAGQGRHRKAELYEQRDGQRADPAGGPGHQDLALGRVETGLQKGVDAQGRGEARGAEHHAVARRQSRGNGDDPVVGDPDIVAVTTPHLRTQAIAGHEHRTGRGVVGAHARGIDARHMGEALDDARLAARGEGILIVEARILDADQDARGLQFIDRASRKTRSNGPAPLFIDHIGIKYGVHARPRGFGAP